MALHPIVEWLAAALILLGAFFLLVGAIGMVRLPDFYMRLHAPTKASTLGVGGVLLASLLLAAAEGRAGVAELLITLFVFLTAPVSANLLAQAALHLRLHSRAPQPEGLVQAAEVPAPQPVPAPASSATLQTPAAPATPAASETPADRAA